MATALGSIPFKSGMRDFSNGVVGGVSDLENRARIKKHLRLADNMVMRPHRALSVRDGSRRLSTALLPKQPHSIGKWRSSSGASKVFTAGWDGSAGTVYEATTSAYTSQTWPYTLTAEWLVFEQHNDVLWATQRGGAQKPAFWSALNAANTWLTAVLPKPGNTLTLTPSTNAAGELTLLATYFYRLRWRYANGASLSSTPQSITLTGTDNRVTVSTIPLGSARPDYVGWTLERTTQFGDVNGDYYFVADGTATSYVDDTADQDLDDKRDELLHAEPPHVDGIVRHKDRNFGWAGSLVYASQVIGDEQATGLCNWPALSSFRFGMDDGDTIQLCYVAGDRLIVQKRRSTWALEGDDLDSFRVVEIASGFGAAGPRAAAAMGGKFWFFDDTGLQLFDGAKVKPAGWVEVAHYFEQMPPAMANKVVVLQYLGQYVLVAYSTNGVYNNEVVVYDQRFDNWTHFTRWNIADALVQKDDDFNRATLIFCDPVDRADIAATSFVNAPSFVAWSDSRVANHQAYVQSLDATGAPRWTANGVQLSNSTSSNPRETATLALGLGQGCIVAYTDRRGGVYEDLYIQKLNDAGVPQWTANGVQLTNVSPGGAADRDSLRIASDGTGGAVVVWRDQRSGSARIYAQRVNASGAVQWTVNGVEVSTVVGNTPALLADGASGAWISFLSTEGGLPIARLQRLDSAGAPDTGFAANGIFVDDVGTHAVTAVSNSALVSDGADGVIVLYRDAGSKAQRFNGTGVRQWASGGVNLLASAPGTAVADSLRACPDGANGMISITRALDGSDRKIFAQRITQAGVIQWGGGGIELAVNAGSDGIEFAEIVSDGADGAVVVWSGGADSNVYAQRINDAGTKLWPDLNVVANATNDQDRPAVCTDGANGAIIVWQDDRTATDDAFYGRMDSSGAQLWTAGGAALVASAGTQTNFTAAFSGSASGEAPALAAAFMLWIGMDGDRDEREQNGTGGVPIPTVVETPDIDDGEPDMWKVLELLEVYARGSAVDIVASIITDGGTVTLQLPTVSGGTLWGAALWGSFNWSGSAGQTVFSGIAPGLRGRQYRIRLAANSSQGQYRLEGFTIYGHRLPLRPFS